MHRIRLEMGEGTGNAKASLEWNNGSGWASVPGSMVKPRYGLVTSTTDDEGRTTALSYSDPANGISPHLGLTVSSTIDPAGLALTESTTYENPATAGTYLRRTARTLPSGASSTYEYYGATETADDPCTTGVVESIVQAGQLKRNTDPDPDGPGPAVALTREMVYDVAGQAVATRVVGDSAWTCTTSDVRGRPTSVSFPAFGGEPARTVTSNYAVGGNPLVTSATDPAGTITTTMDVLGRNRIYTDVWGMTSTTSYDAGGRVTSQTSPAGTMSYAYDGVGQLTSVSKDGLVLANNLIYAADGALAGVSYPSGTGNAGNGTKGVFGVDPTSGLPSSMEWTSSAASLITKDTVSRSVGGSIVGQVVDNADHHAGNDFTYDAAGRLVDAFVPGRRVSYSFAGSGGCGVATGAGMNTNRTGMSVDGGPAVSYCYDHADRLTSTSKAGVGTIAYDGHGNTTTMFGESRVYDSADRHVATSKVGVGTVRYVRDVTDRIVERKVSGVTTARYAYTAGGDISGFTLNPAGAILDVTVSLPGGALLTVNGGGNVWSYPNIHGDLVATANAAGAKTGVTAQFDPYGNLISGVVPDNSTGSFDYGWEGQAQRPLEAQSGFQAVIEMGARQYSPLLGRFLEVDPVEGGSSNNYDYVNGDSVNNEDLDGLRCWTGKNRNGSCRSISCGAGRAVRGGGRAARSAYRHLDVSAGVCPVFGCVGLGFRNGRVRVDYGLGLAVAYPGMAVGWSRGTQRRGCAASRDVVFAQTPAGGVSRSWALGGRFGKRVNGQTSSGLAGPGRGPGWGIGHYRSRVCTS